MKIDINETIQCTAFVFLFAGIISCFAIKDRADQAIINSRTQAGTPYQTSSDVSGVDHFNVGGQQGGNYVPIRTN